MAAPGFPPPPFSQPPSYSLPPGFYTIRTLPVADVPSLYVTAPTQIGNSIFVDARYKDEDAGSKRQVWLISASGVLTSVETRTTRANVITPSSITGNITLGGLPTQWVIRVNWKRDERDIHGVARSDAYHNKLLIPRHEAFIGSIMTSDGYSHFWNVDSTRPKIELDAASQDFVFEPDNLVNNTNV